MDTSDPDSLPPSLLPPGIRARFVDGVNGLRMHVLEAGYGQNRPLILLLHGFPEIAYSFRYVIGPLADAGYHVAAPDLRGYGRTTGAAPGYDVDLQPYGAIGAVSDVLALVAAIGHRDVALVAGHDYGSSVAAACALVRPDVFRSLLMMSAPFGGPPAWNGNTAPADPSVPLAALDPPRKHYHWYYSTRDAARDMNAPPQGVRAILRAYFHHKSADWAANDPHPLTQWSAADLATLPTYYVMRLDETMPQTVAHEMPSPAQISACRWLPEEALAVYAEDYVRTGFQGGLNSYRARTTGLIAREMGAFAGRTIDVPSCFLAGAKDWGTFQKPGDFERMQTICTAMAGCELIQGAGHWLQQEQPDALVARTLAFLGQR